MLEVIFLIHSVHKFYIIKNVDLVIFIDIQTNLHATFYFL